MPGIGADLPPHLLAKRKRQQEEQETDEPLTASGAKRSTSPDGREKRSRVMGPAMPPAPLDERPTEPANATEDDSSDDDDDDDFGPSLPTGGADTKPPDEDEEGRLATHELAEHKPKRDDWMMMPPKQDDLAARLDPTKQRPKGFNTGKGAKGPSAGGEDSSTWHETPEQKQKRLQDEMMGISKTPLPAKTSSSKSKDESTHRKIQDHDKARGPSLMEQHRTTKGAEAEDDPSKRAFDKEKDMASGGRISSSQKREMLNKASNFSGKFSGGTYL